MWRAPLLLAAGLTACGPGPTTKALQADIAQMKEEIERTEQEIAEARQQGESLDDDLATGVSSASEKLVGRAMGSDDLLMELEGPLVSKLVLELLEGYEGTEPAAGQTPEAKWQLKGLRARMHRGRLFLSGSYHVQVGKGQCEGPVNGHLFYLQRNVLKLADLEIRCRTRRHDVIIDVPARLPPIPLPFEIRQEQTLEIKEGVKAPATKLDVVTPVEIDLSSERVRVRSRSVTVREAGK